MNEDQRRLLNHEFRRLMTTAGKEKTPFNEIADQLTDLAVRFARSELEKIQSAPRGEAHNRAVRRLATLGEPEKKSRTQ